jgi:alpha-beta hydrolase superfamily lysophospholipase
MTNPPTESTVETTDKTTLHVKKWTPEGSLGGPKAQVVLIHGYLEHCGRYDEFGQYLKTKGIAMIAFDCRGHGKSSGRRGYVWNFAQYHLDLDAVLGQVDAKIPLFVLGHSAGGLVLLDYLLTNKTKNNPTSFKGVVISSPFLTPANRIPTYKIVASRILAWFVPFLPIPADEEVTAEVLTHDKQKIKEHHEDTLLLQNATVGWGYGVLSTQAKVLSKGKDIPLPVLFAYAGADMVADPATNKKFAAEIVSPDLTVEERKEKYHEILNEDDRTEVFALMSSWILERAK